MNPEPSATRDDEALGAQRRRMPAPERRVVIFEAALRTFASNGYDGAPMDEIAAAAGISKAVVYDHVSSKRELYMTVLEEIRSDLVELIEAALAEVQDDGEARVRRAVEAIFRFAEERPDAGRLLMLELQGANVSEVGEALERRMTQSLASTLGGVPLFRGHPRREEQLTILSELLKSAVLGLAGWWFRNPDAPREELVRRTVDVVWPAIERAARA